MTTRTTIFMTTACMTLVSTTAHPQLGGPDGLMIPFMGRIEHEGVPLHSKDEQPHVFFFVLKHDDGLDGVDCAIEDRTFRVETVVRHGAFSVVIGPVKQECVVGNEISLAIAIEDEESGSTIVLVGEHRIYPAVSASTSGAGGDFVVEQGLHLSPTGTSAHVYTDAAHGFSLFADRANECDERDHSCPAFTVFADTADVESEPVFRIQQDGSVKAQGGITTQGDILVNQTAFRGFRVSEQIELHAGLGVEGLEREVHYRHSSGPEASICFLTRKMEWSASSPVSGGVVRVPMNGCVVYVVDGVWGLMARVGDDEGRVFIRVACTMRCLEWNWTG